jgi:hypothetical protein
MLLLSCCWCRCEERLAAQEKATAAAETAAAKATAKAETAADALTAKEQQLNEWRQLAQASKETASQQLQLSQVCARQKPVWCSGSDQVEACDAWYVGAAACCKQHSKHKYMLLCLQDKLGLRETRLLDELAALRQQLAQEKAAR